VAGRDPCQENRLREREKRRQDSEDRGGDQGVASSARTTKEARVERSQEDESRALGVVGRTTRFGPSTPTTLVAQVESTP